MSADGQLILLDPVGLTHQLSAGNTRFVGYTELIAHFGSEILTPDFQLPYTNYIEQINQMGLSADECLAIIIKQPGYLETYELLLAGEGIYSHVRRLAARAEYVQCYIIDDNIIAAIYNLSDWQNSNLALLDRIRSFALICPEYTAVTDVEKSVVAGFITLINAATSYSGENIIIDIYTLLSKMREEGERVNYAYIVEELLRIAGLTME